jgi:hypothetical protein
VSAHPEGSDAIHPSIPNLSFPTPSTSCAAMTMTTASRGAVVGKGQGRPRYSSVARASGQFARPQQEFIAARTAPSADLQLHVVLASTALEMSPVEKVF